MKGIFLAVLLLPTFLFAQISVDEASHIIDELGRNEVVKPNAVEQMQAWLKMETPWRSHVTRGENPMPLGFAGDIILRSDLLTLVGQVFSISTTFRAGEDDFLATQPERTYPLTDSAVSVLKEKYLLWYPQSPGGRLENSLRTDKGLSPKPEILGGEECFGLWTEYWFEALNEDDLGPKISTTGKSCYRLLKALGNSGLITKDEIEFGKTLINKKEVFSEQCLVERLHKFVADEENKPIRVARRTAYHDLLVSMGQTNKKVLADWVGDGPLPEFTVESLAGVERIWTNLSEAPTPLRKKEFMQGLMDKLNALVPDANFKNYVVKNKNVQSPFDPASKPLISYVELQDGEIFYDSFREIYDYQVLGRRMTRLHIGAFNQALITHGSPFRLRTTGIINEAGDRGKCGWLLTEKEWRLLEEATATRVSTVGSLWRDDLISERLQIISDLKSIGLLPTLSPLDEKRAYARMVNLPQTAIPSEIGEAYGLPLLTIIVGDTLTPAIMLKWVQEAEKLAKGAFTILPGQELANEVVAVIIADQQHDIPIDGRTEASVYWLNNLNKLMDAAGFGEFHLTMLADSITYCFLSKKQAEKMAEELPTFFWLKRSMIEAKNR